MALKAGKNDFTNSMAQAMEKVFKEQLAKGQPKPDEQMKMLFTAIAEGVVSHLVAHPEAFEITINPADVVNGKITATVRITGS